MLIGSATQRGNEINHSERIGTVRTYPRSSINEPYIRTWTILPRPDISLLATSARPLCKSTTKSSECITFLNKNCVI